MEKVTFINAGSAYPNAPLTLVIFVKKLANSMTCLPGYTTTLSKNIKAKQKPACQKYWPVSKCKAACLFYGSTLLFSCTVCAEKTPNAPLEKLVGGLFGVVPPPGPLSAIRTNVV